MTRKQTQEIKVFSLSFLDVLCCGMIAVMVLWMLIQRSDSPNEEVSSGFIEIWQSEFAHFDKANIEGVDETGILTGTVNKPFDIFDAAFQKKAKFLSSFDSDGSGGVGARLNLIFKKDTLPFRLKVKFDTCRSANRIHTAHIRIQTQGKLFSDSFVHTQDAKLASALLPTSTLTNEDRLSYEYEVDPAKPEFEVLIGNGRYTYVKPPRKMAQQNRNLN